MAEREGEFEPVGQGQPVPYQTADITPEFAAPTMREPSLPLRRKSRKWSLRSKNPSSLLRSKRREFVAPTQRSRKRPLQSRNRSLCWLVKEPEFVAPVKEPEKSRSNQGTRVRCSDQRARICRTNQRTRGARSNSRTLHRDNNRGNTLCRGRARAHISKRKFRL